MPRLTPYQHTDLTLDALMEYRQRTGGLCLTRDGRRMSLAINLLFIGHRRLAVALAEIQMHIDDMNWAEATRKRREFGELLAPQLHADEAFIRDELTTLDGPCKPAWQHLQAKQVKLKNAHQRLNQAIDAYNGAEAQRLLPRLSNALKEWGQARIAALACIERVHGDVSNPLARALSPPPTDQPSQ